MIRLLIDFKEFLKLLNEKGVEYLLVGGHAVGCYGYPRPTGAMDIWIGRERANVARMADAMKEFGFSPDDSRLKLLSEADQIFRMGVPPQRIEVLTSIDGVEFKTCHGRREPFRYEDLEIPLIGLDDLKTNKRASGRHKDLADLEELESQ